MLKSYQRRNRFIAFSHARFSPFDLKNETAREKKKQNKQKTNKQTNKKQNKTKQNKQNKNETAHTRKRWKNAWVISMNSAPGFEFDVTTVCLSPES